MRAVNFILPYEVILNTEEEKWLQNEFLHGFVEVNSVENSPVEDIDLRLNLDFGVHKKIKDKKADARETFLEITLEKTVNNQYTFKVQLPYNTPVTTKKEGLYLWLESPSFKDQTCQLPLEIAPHAHINQIVQVFETFYRFKLKEYKNKKSKVEAVFSPPASSKELSSLDSFSAFFEFEGTSLHISFEYKIKVLASELGEAKIDKKTKKQSFQFAQNEYAFDDQNINQQFIQKQIDIVLSEIKKPKLF